MGESWNVGLLINDIDTKSITSFHQYIEIGTAWMDCHPSRVITRSRCFKSVD